jgi:ribosomal protein S18 acetylase RimI-like enzyme
MRTSYGIVTRPVAGPRDMKAFIRFPSSLYASDPCWVPPIWAAERTAYLPGRNAVLDRSDHAILAAWSGDGIVGRIVAYVDPRFNDHFGTRTGFFGSFECVDDPAVSAALFAAAETWFAARGVDRVRGPINPVAECWGLLVDGFDAPPVYLSPYNPPYYGALAEAAGYGRVKDLLVYEADTAKGYEIPERFRRFETMLAVRRPSLTTRTIDPRHIDRDAEYIRSILNAGVDGNWGYVPVERDEMAAVVRDLKPILDPAAVWFVEDDGVPVACCLGFPDVNVILEEIGGRLFPTGALRLLFGARRLHDYRLWGLAVLPKYQGLGLDVLMYLRLSDALARRGVRMEANYILEDNLRIRNALEKLGMSRIKTYRVYEKALRAIDAS